MSDFNKTKGHYITMNILLVEDDQSIAMGLEYSLSQENFSVQVCPTMQAALREIKQKNFDLALLDISLPDGNGYEICKAIKEEGDFPVIFLTACDDEVNVVMGLDMGADDFITKPFRIRELISRIKSVLRRYHRLEHPKTVFAFENIKVNTAQAKVYKKEQEIILTALEYRLLLALINAEGKVLSRNSLLESIWDVAGDFVNDNTLTVYIKRLREKLEDDVQNPKIIQTVRGLGYKVGD